MWTFAAIAMAVIAAVAVGRSDARSRRLVALSLASTAVLDAVLCVSEFRARIGQPADERFLRYVLFPAVGWVLAAIAFRSLTRVLHDIPPSAGFAGLWMFVLGGAANVTALWSRTVVGTAPVWITRLAVACSLGVGGGVAGRFMAELRRPAPTPGMRSATEP